MMVSLFVVSSYPLSIHMYLLWISLRKKQNKQTNPKYLRNNTKIKWDKTKTNNSE